MLESWSASFAGTEPIAHVLRERFKDRWVRFHSLPDSQRWPTNEAEYAIILQRHNDVLSAVAAEGDKLVLLSTAASDSSTPPPPPEQTPTARWWRTMRHGGFSWHVYAQEINWRPGTLDPILRQVPTT